MTDDNLPPLPEPAFRLKLRDGEYKVTKPNIGDTDVYTAAQVEEARRAAVSAMREALEQIQSIDAMSPEGGREEIAEIHAIARAALRATKE